jgi:hypothetical protein
MVIGYQYFNLDHDLLLGKRYAHGDYCAVPGSSFHLHCATGESYTFLYALQAQGGLIFCFIHVDFYTVVFAASDDFVL